MFWQFILIFQFEDKRVSKVFVKCEIDCESIAVAFSCGFWQIARKYDRYGRERDYLLLVVLSLHSEGVVGSIAASRPTDVANVALDRVARLLDHGGHV